ncbi:hypothetical protein ILUMI_04783 [Ignelater luminosus]|uniref:MIT domain-containing protein n=1 Tax=Ignelater luminosus TaxID=2038154 RepID=A0A8K0DC77_IGNLU|nr:hypothetical protein ILUMI_04783 [Ignelater luminosus]
MSLQVAGNVLLKAVELDNKKRYTEALLYYKEGLQLLLDLLKGDVGDKRTSLRKKAEEYMKRAEEIKQIVENLKQEGTFHEQIHIENNATGYSYEKVFGRFLDEDVEYVEIEDPYIRAYHQCQNFVRFCELLVKKCNKLRTIQLLTTADGTEQQKWLTDVTSSLAHHRIHLNISYSETLHDRQIKLSTGWIIKIGRGLDYFKAPETKFSLGVFETDFRTCHETTIDIFHSNNVRNI